jgi:hypothetical protein
MKRDLETIVADGRINMSNGTCGYKIIVDGILLGTFSTHYDEYHKGWKFHWPDAQRNVGSLDTSFQELVLGLTEDRWDITKKENREEMRTTIRIRTEGDLKTESFGFNNDESKPEIESTTTYMHSVARIRDTGLTFYKGMTKKVMDIYHELLRNCTKENTHSYNFTFSNAFILYEIPREGKKQDEKFLRVSLYGNLHEKNTYPHGWHTWIEVCRGGYIPNKGFVEWIIENHKEREKLQDVDTQGVAKDIKYLLNENQNATTTYIKIQSIGRSETEQEINQCDRRYTPYANEGEARESRGHGIVCKVMTDKELEQGKVNDQERYFLIQEYTIDTYCSYDGHGTHTWTDITEFSSLDALQAVQAHPDKTRDGISIEPGKSMCVKTV